MEFYQMILAGGIGFLLLVAAGCDLAAYRSQQRTERLVRRVMGRD